MNEPLGVDVQPLASTFGAILEARDGVRLTDLEPEPVASIFQRSGALLFRSFQATQDEFEAFTDSLGQEFSTYQGGGFRFGVFDRAALNPERTILSATGKTQDFAIPLHGEMYYFRRHPELIWFYCAQAAESGGETTVGDGAEVFRHLSPATRSLLLGNRVKYVRNLADGDWQVAFQTEDRAAVEQVCRDNATEVLWQEDGALVTEFVTSAVFERDPGGPPVFINTLLPVLMGEAAVRSGALAALMPDRKDARPPIVVRLEDGSPFPEAVVGELLAVTDRLVLPVSWRQGDVLMVDNDRILHGRRSSNGGQRAIYVRMGAARFRPAGLGA